MNMCSYNCCSAAMPNSNAIENVAKTLKLLGEPNRLRILCILNTDEEHCVCEFKDHLPNLSQSLLSHHLADLRAGGLVESVKRGQRVYYTLTDSGEYAVNHIIRIKTEAAQ